MRYYNVLLITVFLAVFGIGYVMAIKPKNQEIAQNIQAANQQKQEEKEGLRKTIANYSAYIEKFNDLDSRDLARANAILPDVNDQDSLFLQLEHLFKKHNFVLNSISIASPKSNDSGRSASRRSGGEDSGEEASRGISGVSEIDLELSFEALGYSAFKRLLKVIEDNLRVLDIGEINFSGDDSVITLQVKTYFLQDDAETKD